MLKLTSLISLTGISSSSSYSDSSELDSSSEELDSVGVDGDFDDVPKLSPLPCRLVDLSIACLGP
jgi:hypothetical protein